MCPHNTQLLESRQARQAITCIRHAGSMQQAHTRARAEHMIHQIQHAATYVQNTRHRYTTGRHTHEVSQARCAGQVNRSQKKSGCLLTQKGSCKAPATLPKPTHSALCGLDQSHTAAAAVATAAAARREHYPRLWEKKCSSPQN